MILQQNQNSLAQPLGDLLADWEPAVRPRREVMTGEHCRLEPVNPGKHVESLYAANNNDTEGRMWTYLPYGPFASFEQYKSWLNDVSKTDDPLFYAIIDIPSGLALGLASYLRIDVNNGCIEVGHLAYAPALQRTIVATEAMFLMMAQAFRLGYRRYEWKCNALNSPSRRAAERLGFQYEGIFRQALVMKGRNRDTAWYSVIDKEWPALEKIYKTWLAKDNFDEHGMQRTSLSSLTRTLR